MGPSRPLWPMGPSMPGSPEERNLRVRSQCPWLRAPLAASHMIKRPSAPPSGHSGFWWALARPPLPLSHCSWATAHPCPRAHGCSLCLEHSPPPPPSPHARLPHHLQVCLNGTFSVRPYSNLPPQCAVPCVALSFPFHDLPPTLLCTSLIYRVFLPNPNISSDFCFVHQCLPGS